jgi:membrane fusion protein (multidrug efflux system)
MSQSEDFQPQPGPPRRNPLRRVLLIGGPVLVVVVALVVYLAGGRYVSTDDAYIQAARVDVSTNISGRVIQVAVRDNEAVRAGQLLLRLDPRRYQIAVDDAQAALDSARRKVLALEASLRQQQAQQRSAQNTLAFQQREFDRQTKLAASGLSSKTQLDQAGRDLQAAHDQVAAQTAQAASTAADLGDAGTPLDQQPSVRQAQAALDRAKLELSYTTVYAPIDGIVTKVEQLQDGDYINAAAPLFALVSQHDLWVEANFKETELTYMRPGQAASFHVDAYPGRTLKGEVQSTSPGTGSSFALLPPENASGNWVKVVQRLPVRLSIDPRGASDPLAAGMSVKVKVDTNHHRTLFGGS